MNTPLGGPIDYSLGWQEWLTAYANGFGELSRPDSMDYFVYPKGYWKVYPPFAAGRPRFDNWMIREAKRRGTPIIDATGKILAVHQNHDYGHIPGNSDSRKVEGPEVKGNIRLYGEHTPCYTTLDADYKLTDGGLTRSYNMIAFKHDVRRLLKI
jgi:hypothetical protein